MTSTGFRISFGDNRICVFYISTESDISPISVFLVDRFYENQKYIATYVNVEELF